MLALGFYWCAQVYQSWKSQPFQTTISTAELPIDKVKMMHSRNIADIIILGGVVKVEI